MVIQVVCLALSLFGAVLFIQAGALKLLKSEQYRITAEQLLGRNLPHITILLLGLLEMAVGFGFLHVGTRVFASITGGVLLVTYAIAMARQLKVGNINLRCGCSALNSNILVSNDLISRNLLTAAVLFLVAVLGQPAPSLDFAVIGAVLAGVLILSYASFEQVISIRQAQRGAV